MLLYLRKIFIVKMYFEKKLKKIITKMPKFRDIAIFQIPTTPDRNYKHEVITNIKLSSEGVLRSATTPLSTSNTSLPNRSII
jgi:hypothetical protein